MLRAPAARVPLSAGNVPVFAFASAADEADVGRGHPGVCQESVRERTLITAIFADRFPIRFGFLDPPSRPSGVGEQAQEKEHADNSAGEEADLNEIGHITLLERSRTWH